MFVQAVLYRPHDGGPVTMRPTVSWSHFCDHEIPSPEGLTSFMVTLAMNKTNTNTGFLFLFKTDFIFETDVDITLVTYVTKGSTSSVGIFFLTWCFN